MSSVDKHCGDCIEALGRPFREVHEWLDDMAICEDRVWGNHHKERHHKEGLNDVEVLFGLEGVEAAKIHIQQDMYNMFGNKRILSRAEIEELLGPDRWYKKSEVFGE